MFTTWSRASQGCSALFISLQPSRALQFPLRRAFSASTRQRKSASSSAGVTYALKDLLHARKIATITVANPAKLNIVNSALLSQLTSVCRSISEEDNVRAVVLTGGETVRNKPASFIGGADITEMIRLSSASDARNFIGKIHDACSALRSIPAPVIARIHGLCLGAGLEIAAACDLRVCTADSLFGMPEVMVGIPSVVEAALLPTLIGMGRARRLCYLAENVSATIAERWGLVEEVVGDENELDKLVEAWVGRIASAGPKAIRSQKKLVAIWENSGVNDGIEAGIESFAQAFADGGQEPKEFMGRFVNRRR